MTFRRKFERCNRDRTDLYKRSSAEFGMHFGVEVSDAGVSQSANGTLRVTGAPEGTGSQHE
jgi:hypothetical protein